MRFIVISDTHGNLAPVTRLAKEDNADACLHLGDCCCVTRNSVSRFSQELLEKSLKHSQIPRDLLAEANDITTMRELAVRYRTYGDFEDYFSGSKSFSIPVYAVPGNNEDRQVVAQLREHPLPNLFFLDENNSLEIEGFCLYGIGGDILSDSGTANEFGWCSCSRQVEKLQQRMTTGSCCPKIQLSHIPPYESEIVDRLTRTVKPVLALCGHTHHWDERTLGDSNWICQGITLPKLRRGFAILELHNGKFNCKTYKDIEVL